MVISGEEPIHLDIFLPAPSRATTPSPTFLSLLFLLPIPPRLVSPSPSLNNKDIIATNEWFFTPEGSPAPSYYKPEAVPASPTIAASEEALSDTDTDVQPEQAPLPEV